MSYGLGLNLKEGDGCNGKFGKIKQKDLSILLFFILCVKKKRKYFI